ncbi:MAG: hypothetical protein V2A58_06445 [Planctomycetota bacterium]
MADDDVTSHLDALKRYVRECPAKGADQRERAVRQAQLLAIQRTVGELERRGVPVPESLSAEMISLASAVDSMEDAVAGCAGIYEALLDIVAELGTACGKRPHRDLYLKFKERRSHTTPAETLRAAIVEVLKGLGGSGAKTKVLAELEGKLQGKLTPADRELSRAGRSRWKQNAQREARRMVKERALVLGSRKGTWQLGK